MAGDIALDELGTIIQNRREQLQLSQSEAARRAGIARSTYIEIEQAKRTRSTQATLDRIDQALEWEPGTLRSMIGRSTPGAEEYKTSTMTAARQQLMAYAATLSGDHVEQALRFIRSVTTGEPDIFDQIAALRAQLEVVIARVQATEQVHGERLRARRPPARG